MSVLSIELPAEMETRLQSLVETTGRSKADYILDALHEHLGDMEDLYIAESRLADLRAGRTKSIPLDEVERNLGLVD